MLKYCQETFRADIHINFSKFQGIFGISGVGGGAFGWGTALQAGKVAGSIPDEVNGLFYRLNLPGRTMALGVESASNISEYHGDLLAGKDGRCVKLTTLPRSCADCLNIPEAPTSRGHMALYRDSYFEFLRHFKIFNYLFHNTSRNPRNPDWGTLLHGVPSHQTAICNARSLRNICVLWR